MGSTNSSHGVAAIRLRKTDVQALRSIGAVILGYLVFAVSAVVSFRLSGQPPHAAAPPGVMLAHILVGVVAAFVGGYVAAHLAGRRPAAHGLAVALVLAVGAAASLLSTIGHGAIWSQLSALVLMAPGAALGGWVRARRA